MEYGITGQAQFNPSKVEDDRTVFERLDRDGLVKIFLFNGLEFNPKTRKDVLLVQLQGIVASGRQINIPLPGGASAPMKVSPAAIAPNPLRVTRDAPPPQPGPQAPPPQAQPQSVVSELTGEAIPSNDVLVRMAKIKDMKFFALKALAKKHNMACPSGMSAVERAALARSLAEAEQG